MTLTLIFSDKDDLLESLAGAACLGNAGNARAHGPLPVCVSMPVSGTMRAPMMPGVTGRNVFARGDEVTGRMPKPP